MKRRIVLLLASTVPLFAACLQDIPDDIPCYGDGECPTNYFCGGVRCVSSDGNTPPELVFLGVRKDKSSPRETSITLEPKGYQSFYAAFANTGTLASAYPEISFEAEACLRLSPKIGSNLVGILRQNDETEQSIDIFPDPNCPSPATIKVTMKSQGVADEVPRIFDDEFTITLTP